MYIRAEVQARPQRRPPSLSSELHPPMFDGVSAVGAETESIFGRVATRFKILAALARYDFVQAITLAIRGGQRDENRLTDMMFFSLHPERKGRKLKRSEKTLARKWRGYRDEWVRPLLRQEAARRRKLRATITVQDANKLADRHADRFARELLDPKLAADVFALRRVIRDSLWGIDKAVKFYKEFKTEEFDQALVFAGRSDTSSAALPSALEHAEGTLRAIDKVLTITDPDERKKLLRGISDQFGRGRVVAGLTDLLSFGVEAASDAVSLSSVVAYGVARALRNRAVLKAAEAYLKKSAKVVKTVAPVIDGLNLIKGAFVLMDDKATTADKEAAVVNMTAAAIGSASAIGWLRGVSSLGLTVSIEVNYRILKWLASKYWSMVLATTANGLVKTYARMRRRGVAIAPQLLRTERLLDLALENPGVPAYAKALDNSTRGLYEAVNKFRRNFRDLRPPMRTRFLTDKVRGPLATLDAMHKSGDIGSISGALAAVLVGREILEQMRNLYLEYSKILRSETRRLVKEYKKSRWL